jgi:hypothetical protein
MGRDRGRRPALLVGCALALLLGYAGCLNPRPEEDPSANVEGVPSSALDPARDSCMSNPALPECAVPVQGGESDAPPADLDIEDGADPNASAGEPPAAAPAPPVDAGSSAADTTSDAGLPVEPADASVP